VIESGSHVAGVCGADFRLPAGTALRYERPDAALAGLVSSYAVLDADPAVWTGPDDWLLPSWAQIWFVLTDQPVAVTIGNRHYAPLGAAILYGVTSRAMPVASGGGVSIVADITPRGWARLFAHPADALRDRITPLGELLPADAVASLIDELGRSDRGAAVKGMLDAFLTAHLPPPHPAEPLVDRIAGLLADPATTDLPAAAARLGISARALLGATKRYFGFPPKTLLMRTRFMRAFVPMLTADSPPDFSAVPPGYHDVPHFLRDARRFLGLTPRRFLAMDMPYLRAAMRARTLVTGIPTPALDGLR